MAQTAARMRNSTARMVRLLCIGGLLSIRGTILSLDSGVMSFSPSGKPAIFRCPGLVWWFANFRFDPCAATAVEPPIAQACVDKQTRIVAVVGLACTALSSLLAYESIDNEPSGRVHSDTGKKEARRSCFSRGLVRSGLEGKKQVPLAPTRISLLRREVCQ